jgi:hypothetical protein
VIPVRTFCLAHRDSAVYVTFDTASGLYENEPLVRAGVALRPDSSVQFSGGSWALLTVGLELGLLRDVWGEFLLALLTVGLGLGLLRDV